jgi:hypothetical protein
VSAIVVSFAVLAAGAVTGGLALHRWGWRGLPLAWGAVALAPALGYGPVSLAVFAWTWCGRAGGPPALVAAAVGFAVLLVALTPRRPPRPAPVPEPWPRTLALAAVAVGVVSLAGVTAAAPALMRAQPLGGHDAHAIWNVHALFLLRAPADPSPLFRDMRLGHPDYPLLLPGAIAGQWALTGGEEVAIPQAVGAAFLLATALVVGAALGARNRPLAGCVAIALYVSTPNALRWGFGQCADVPLSYLFALAAVGCTGLVGREPRAPLPPVLAGFCLGLLAWTKNEGVVLAVLVGGWLVMLHWLRGGSPRPWGALALGAAVPLLAVALYKLNWSPRNEIAEVYLQGAVDRIADAGRWRKVAAAFGVELDPLRSWRPWGAVWPYVLLGWLATAVALPRRHQPDVEGLAWIVASAFGAWFLIYVAGSPKLSWQLQTSLDRLLLQLLPVALICAFDLRHRDGEPG